MFRGRSCFDSAGGTCPVLSMLSKSDKGVYFHRPVSARQKLPRAELFDLGEMVRSKTDLKQVSTKILAPADFTIDFGDKPQPSEPVASDPAVKED